jgi:uncharacterized membrane protein YgdD (TMEM256/DUF423 family)
MNASGMSARGLLIAAGLSGAVAVALGAFGAHGLAEAVSPERLVTWRTGASYHLAHALGMAVAALGAQAGWRTELAGTLFLVGTVLFSGALYALVLLDLPVLGAVAPLGGASFIAGWLGLAWAGWRRAER